MEALGCIIPLVLLLIAAPLIVALVALSRIGKLEKRVAQLSAGLRLTAGSESVPRPQAAPVSVAVPPPPATAAQNIPSPQPAPAASHVTPAINWESLLGVKLFAWIGGFAFFLGVVFFVKYAFENNLVTPVMRIAIGGIVGALLVVAGALAATRRYRVPAQSLCATGVLVLYADIYAAHAFYALMPLGVASFAMCVVTAGALWLATRLDAQSVVWLAALGGFVTPALLWTRQDNPLALFGYVVVLNFGLAAVAALKRWNYFILLAAIGTVAIEASWAADFFGVATAEVARRILLGMEAQFLAICIARQRFRSGENWSAVATALVGFAALLFCTFASDDRAKFSADFIYPILFFADAGLIGIAVARRAREHDARLGAAIVAAGLLLTWLAEWAWHEMIFESAQPHFGLVWYVAIFLLFAATPYFCGINRLWPWSIAAIAGPLQFWFVYRLVVFRFPGDFMFLLPVAFGVPAAVALLFLLRRERVALAAGDSRVATQSAALVFFISLIFPVQFEHEWITLGWAIEGVALLLLFRRIPHRLLRIAALIVLCAAFIRLAINPAVFEYHKRSSVRIWNWYLYAYGVAGVCFFAAARLFGSMRTHFYERHAPALLAALGAIVLFLLLNIQIADYFSIGPTLTFSFSGDFARDMTYTIAWAIFAFVLLLIGMFRNVRVVRIAGVALLFVALAKLFLHDLDQLNQLYRIAAFLSVAVIAIVASFVYQRFLAPKTGGA
jgi:hypothetical protein